MTKSTLNYKQLSSQLDDILARLQNADVDIDEATKLYEQGTQIVKQLETYLKTAENKVAKLKKNFKA